MVTLTEEYAIERARELDTELAAGKDLSDDATAAVKKATNDLTAAAKKATAK